MNQKIKILHPHEAIKIAAGEVVERPAHIVKELIENSIDAGAKNITLHLQAAGKDLIKITDDGSGMSPEDANLCFAHHATSKISTVNDLPCVMTYGFRGEALSSIASVAHVELITKTHDTKLATHLKLEHATLVSQNQASHPTGTTFIISHLFDNIPARKKFLKADETEWNLIVTIIQAFCLRYPNIHFKVFHNDYLAYNCPATTLIKNRCAQLWSNQLHDQLLELTPTTKDKITVSGAISNTHYYRFNRGQIFTFVNNRWVKNHELSKAILKGYDNVLPSQKFPAAFVFIDLDPTTIDINIHPKKEEVKFLNPGIVQRVIEETVKKCLNSMIGTTLQAKHEPYFATKTLPTATQSIEQINAANINKQNKFEDVYPEDLSSSANIWSDSTLDDFFPNKSTLQTSPFKESEQNIHQPPEQIIQSENHTRPDHTSSDNLTHTPSDQINATIYQQEPYSIVGQFKKTYIMIEKSEHLVMIDQHAAHERILYERFKANSTQMATVQLLFPHIVKLTPFQLQQLVIYQTLFTTHGILFEQFSDHEIIIQATPVQMSAPSAQEIIHTILAWLQQHQQLDHDDLFTQLYEKIVAEKACKAACKAGDTLNHEQMQNLLKELQKTANNFCCPHGRPVMWTLQLKDIEKQFKRDYTGAKQNFFDF